MQWTEPGMRSTYYHLLIGGNPGQSLDGNAVASGHRHGFQVKVGLTLSLVVLLGVVGWANDLEGMVVDTFFDWTSSQVCRVVTSLSLQLPRWRLLFSKSADDHASERLSLKKSRT